MRPLAAFVFALAAGCASSVTPLGDAGPDAHGTGVVGTQCMTPADCNASTTCVAGTCVTAGQLRFTLTWNTTVDLDLHVRAPGGEEIFYGNSSAADGRLDIDDCVGEICRHADATHIENIYFDASARHGTYEFWAVNFDGHASASFDVEAVGETSGGASIHGTLPAVAGSQSAHSSVTY